MARTIRIGGAGGFLGDSATAAPQLIAAGVDYLILDYLAEATMSALARAKAKNPAQGYARDFTDWVWKDNLPAIKAQGVRIVTNAGGVNPQAARARMEKLAAEAGIALRIAVVEGDDLLPQVGALAARGLSEMFKGEAFPPAEAILSCNAYLGAAPIAAALAAGADIVLTGRVVDSALTLGILMHEFGWTHTDYDLLAAGSLAGHVIECGAQATGALFTDWEQVPDWAHIGYPIIECAADGSFVVTKPDGTGGLVSPATVAEQIVYEIGDPQAYLLPDVACDFAHVRVAEAGAGRVRVTGARGRPPSGSYKLCVTWKDGWRCIAVMPVVGRDAARKAEQQSSAIITRVEEMLRARNLPPFRATRIEALGAEASYGAATRARSTREVVCKVGVEHDDAAALDVFLREFDAPMTSMSVGTTGWFGGRPAISPVVRLFSTLIPREEVAVTVALDGQVIAVPPPPPGPRFEPAAIVRPPVPQAPAGGDDLVTVDLLDLAWARSGDKGDSFNVGVIARDPAWLPWIRAALSEAAVMDFFAHEFEGATAPRVERFELPGLDALNFLLSDALGGGQFASLRVDPLAKGKAQQLLEFPVQIPAALVAKARRAA
ncbi:acyclic terpene utilization AtuA family protein [Zavarzinia sp. CC-PAN008]|uniref:acyclic terpene utilization AtuA family protein n=1 Tax=Zavarzinia sp. CC-PAN008 TaxID=3243332 RepID=UPI003F743711